MRRGTLVVRAGNPDRAPGSPLTPGPAFAATFHSPGDPTALAFTYGRFHNPTWTAYETALGALEGGPVVAFASGMAAVTAVLGATLRSGDLVVMPSDGYYTVRALAEGYLREMGVTARFAPTAGGAQGSLLKGARLLWLETPSNPGLDVCDIAALAGAAHEAGALVAVDNTTATALGQQPLALGADFSVASDTKALSGHHDLVLGHAAAADPQWAERLLAWRSQTGAVPGPMETWLAHRSLPTLELRLQRQCATALAIAQFLAHRLGPTKVRYPGLPADPSFATAVRQMEFFGPVVSFILGGRTQAETFLSSCRLVDEATSFGGVFTTAERRARWGGDAVPDGFVRLSAGCEDSDDLLADLDQALHAAGR